MKTKKTTIPKEGIFLFENSKGFGFRLKQNQHKLVTAQGYDTKQGAKKGIMAVARMLKSNILPVRDLNIIDLTKK